MAPQKIIGALLVGYLGVVAYVSVIKHPKIVDSPAVEHTMEVDLTKPESQVNPEPVELLPVAPLEEVKEIEEVKPTTPISIIKKLFKKKEIQEPRITKNDKPRENTKSVVVNHKIYKPMPSYVPRKSKCDNDYARINEPYCRWVRDVFEEHGHWKRLHNDKYGPE